MATTVKAKAKTKGKAAAASPGERRAAQLAAIERRAKRDRARAERELVELVPSLRSNREKTRAAKLLLVLGTERATALALDLYFEDDIRLPLATLRRADRERFFAQIVALLPSLDLSREPMLLDLDIIDACEDEELPREIREAIAMALVAGAHVTEHARRRAIESLVATGDPELVAQLASDDPNLPFEVRARVAFATDPRGAYERFVEDFRTTQERRDVIMHALDERADPRWIHEVLAIVSQHPPTITGVLAKLRAADELADLAARPELDEIARSALMHSRGSAIRARASSWSSGSSCRPGRSARR